MHNKTLFILISFIITCTILSSQTVKSQDLEIPFDYLYGRWVNGHHADLNYIINKNKENTRDGDYTFKRQKHSFNLVHLQEYILIDNKSNYMSTPFISYNYRPTTKWQIGLDSLNFLRYYTSKYKYAPDIKRPKRDYIRGKISSRRMSDKHLKVKTKNSSYFYYIDKIVGKSQYILENNIRLNYQNKYDLFWRSGRSATRDANEDFYWNFNNKFSYGLTENLNIKLNLNAYFHTSNSNEISEHIQGDTLSIVRVTNSENKLKRFDYKISFIDLRILPFYYYLSFGQNNTISIIDKYNLTYFYDNIFEEYSEYERNYNFHTNQNNWEITVGYLSNNNFNPNIILDDYNNYYHNLLFHKQYNISLKLNYDFGKTRYDFKSNNTALNFKSAIGLFNKIEIGFTAEYHYDNYDERRHFSYFVSRKPEIDLDDKIIKVNQSLSGYDSTVTVYAEKIQAGLNLKYRSYEYDKNSLQNWNNDSEYDIAFGSILQAKQIYLELNYIPLDYQVETYQKVINFFEFVNLSNQFNGYLNIYLSVGLGKQFTLSTYYFATLPKKKPTRYTFININGRNYDYTNLATNKKLDISLSKRLKKKFELSVDYKYQEINKAETITGSLKIIL